MIINSESLFDARLKLLIYHVVAHIPHDFIRMRFLSVQRVCVGLILMVVKIIGVVVNLLIGSPLAIQSTS